MIYGVFVWWFEDENITLPTDMDNFGTESNVLQRRHDSPGWNGKRNTGNVMPAKRNAGTPERNQASTATLRRINAAVSITSETMRLRHGIFEDSNNVINAMRMRKDNFKVDAAGLAVDNFRWWYDGTQCAAHWQPSLIERAKILCGCGIWFGVIQPGNEQPGAMPAVFATATDVCRHPSVDSRHGIWLQRVGGLYAATWHPAFLERLRICAAGVWICTPSREHPAVNLDVEEMQCRFKCLERVAAWLQSLSGATPKMLPE